MGKVWVGSAYRAGELCTGAAGLARPDPRAALPVAAHGGVDRVGTVSGPSAQGSGNAPEGRAQCADVQTNHLRNQGGKGKPLL